MDIIVKKGSPDPREIAARKKAYWDQKLREHNANENHREKTAAEVAEYRRQTAPKDSPLGRPVAVVPLEDAAHLNHKYKDGEFGSDEWLKHYQKTHPHLCPAKL